jgi:uncharacterized alpha-E superfamily protein
MGGGGLTVLLSRVAENLYWAGRYLERAEGTARAAREHTNLLVDLPTSVPLTWEPLLAVTGAREPFDARYERADELSILRFLIADRENAGSIVMSVEQAREDLRTTREVLPREVWQVVNDLYLYVASHHTEGIARRSRTRFLDRVIGDVMRVTGLVDATMSRDEAHQVLELGRLVERADMTTRIVDVRAAAIMAAPPYGVDTYDEVQWMSVLRSLSALQMFHRTMRSSVDGPATLRFLFFDERFPRAVAHCLMAIERAVTQLPRAELVEPACRTASARLGAIAVDDLTADALHDTVDELQLALAAIDAAIAEAWFVAAVP